MIAWVGIHVDEAEVEDHRAAITLEVVVGQTKTGKAIRPSRRTSRALVRLRVFVATAKKRSDLDEWRRGVAVLGYIEKRRVIDLARELQVTRGSVNRWLQWYDAAGLDGLRTLKAVGPRPKLTPDQQRQLANIVEAGPIAAGYQSGVWTGPMIGDLIEKRFGVRYHPHHVPRLLNQLGFSVQRPRKRLARADAEQQRFWMRVRFPAIKKKPTPVEAS